MQQSARNTKSLADTQPNILKHWIIIQIKSQWRWQERLLMEIYVKEKTNTTYQIFGEG
jgi:hypothetical protein